MLKISQLLMNKVFIINLTNLQRQIELNKAYITASN